jgi:hypothetical protein
VSAWLAALVAPPAVGDANSGGKFAQDYLGNEDYAKQNASYGLTTLRNRHVMRRSSVFSLARTFLGRNCCNTSTRKASARM